MTIDSNFFYTRITGVDPYGLNSVEKKKLLLPHLVNLTNHHLASCKEYKSILEFLKYYPESIQSMEDIPFIPARLFKLHSLRSTKIDEFEKEITSSGTSKQELSKINLDRTTIRNQTKVLGNIVSSFIGKKRLPMLVIDSPDTVNRRNNFSARTAGIQGFSIFASKREFCLNEDYDINFKVLDEFLSKYGDQPFLIFGFTFMVWKHFYQKLSEMNYSPDLQNGILFHGGGWKKLTELSGMSSSDFKSALKESFNISNIHDYYGMVEQTGSLFVECDQDVLHASNYSDILFRSPHDFKSLSSNQLGLIQVISVIPESYPGHSILTEDQGMLLGEDDCSCGRLGKYFKIVGRLKNAELRGCSDTYANQF